MKEESQSLLGNINFYVVICGYTYRGGCVLGLECDGDNLPLIVASES